MTVSIRRRTGSNSSDMESVCRRLLAKFTYASNGEVQAEIYRLAGCWSYLWNLPRRNANYRSNIKFAAQRKGERNSFKICRISCAAFLEFKARAEINYICSTTSIPRTSRPCFKTRAVKSQSASRDSRTAPSALSTGQFSKKRMKWLASS